MLTLLLFIRKSYRNLSNKKRWTGWDLNARFDRRLILS